MHTLDYSSTCFGTSHAFALFSRIDVQNHCVGSTYSGTVALNGTETWDMLWGTDDGGGRRPTASAAKATAGARETAACCNSR